MTNIKKLLSSLGLLDSEIKTYLAALQNGPSTVIELSKQTGLSRQACYVAIEALSNRGIMSSAMHGKKRFFAAEHPEKLVSYAEHKEKNLQETIQDLKRALPELELRVGGEKPVVKVFEGKEGIRAIIEDLSEEKPQIIREITDADALYSVLTPQDLQSLRADLQKAKTQVNGIYTGTTSEKNPVQSNRIFLDENKKGFSSNISVYKNKIALMTFKGKMYSIIVESPELAQAFNILFDLAFEKK